VSPVPPETYVKVNLFTGKVEEILHGDMELSYALESELVQNREGSRLMFTMENIQDGLKSRAGMYEFYKVPAPKKGTKRASRK